MTEASGGTPAAFETISFPTRDGRTLSGRLYRPAEAPGLAVVIHPGAGFPGRYYADFAAWLAAGHDAAVLIYDYRDFGWSLAGPLRQSKATFRDWAVTDQSAALSELMRRFPDLPPRVIGHSLGGQFIAFHEGAARIDRVVAVASGPGWWRAHPWSYMPQVIAFWWLVAPAATALAGYLPGRRIGLGADLPASVYWEWRRYCLTPGYHRIDWGGLLPDPDLAGARFDLTLVPVEDDVMIPPAQVRKLPEFYPQARVGERLIDPAAFGLKSVGHHGVFLAANRVVWPTVTGPLLD